jgi:hypothetical protein
MVKVEAVWCQKLEAEILSECSLESWLQTICKNWSATSEGWPERWSMPKPLSEKSETQAEDTVLKIPSIWLNFRGGDDANTLYISERYVTKVLQIFKRIGHEGNSG